MQPKECDEENKSHILKCKKLFRNHHSSSLNRIDGLDPNSHSRSISNNSSKNSHMPNKLPYSLNLWSKILLNNKLKLVQKVKRIKRSIVKSKKHKHSPQNQVDSINPTIDRCCENAAKPPPIPKQNNDRIPRFIKKNSIKFINGHSQSTQKVDRQEKSLDLPKEQPIEKKIRLKKFNSEEKKIKNVMRTVDPIPLDLSSVNETIISSKKLKEDDITIKDISPDNSNSPCAVSQPQVKKTMIITKKMFNYNYNNIENPFEFKITEVLSSTPLDINQEILKININNQKPVKQFRSCSEVNKSESSKPESNPSQQKPPKIFRGKGRNYKISSDQSLVTSSESLEKCNSKSQTVLANGHSMPKSPSPVPTAAIGRCNLAARPSARKQGQMYSNSSLKVSKEALLNIKAQKGKRRKVGKNKKKGIRVFNPQDLKNPLNFCNNIK